jgi:uncharacterized protein (TIGR00304 family)
MSDWNSLITFGIILIFLGLFLIVFRMITHSVQEGAKLEASDKKEATFKGGGVVLIGPLPIIFGSDKRFALMAIMMAIVIILLGIIFLK